MKEIKKIPFGLPMIDKEEIEAVSRVLESNILTHGPAVKEFEEAFAHYLDVKNAIALSSCTAALHLSLMALDVGPGDEVIVPSQTHVATAHAVEYCGAKPVFIDATLETGNADLDMIGEKITSRTKAVEIVHFIGFPFDMKKLTAVVKNTPVVEDCAVALGAEYGGKKIGSLGISGCFSFYPIKHISTAEGGMLTTDNDEIAHFVGKARAFGIDRSIEERKVPGIYDVKYLGNNYRMSEIKAALGLVQLKKLEGMNKKRRENYSTLRKLLEEIEGIVLFKQPDKNSTSAHFCLSVMLPEDFPLSRDDFVAKLNIIGIGTSTYYGTPVPLMSYYRNKYGYKPGDFPNAEFIANRSIALPVGPHLNRSDMEYIAEAVQKICSQ
ncbi:MAG: DegT/DnrJ/EryC1/StrS family aminotransferase [Candidatus Aminicenantaceae bacterium]